MKRTFLYVIFLIVFSIAPSMLAYAQAVTARISATEIYEKSLPAIAVLICVSKNKERWMGSGVILRSDGVIATNYP